MVVTNKNENENDPRDAVDVIVNSVKRPDFLAASSPRSSGRSVVTLGDVDDNFEEFIVDMSSSDNSSHHQRCKPVVDLLSPIHQMTKHKTGLKPSDIKYRDRLRTVMSGVTQMEEQVDEKTTVTYWTEPFL